MADYVWGLAAGKLAANWVVGCNWEAGVDHTTAAHMGWLVSPAGWEQYQATRCRKGALYRSDNKPWHRLYYWPDRTCNFSWQAFQAYCVVRRAL